MTAEMAFQLLKIYKFKEHKREKKKKTKLILTSSILDRIYYTLTPVALSNVVRKNL